MTDTFQARIPALSEAELRQYLERHLEYRAEAVEAALAELDRRGLALSSEERARIRQGLDARDAVAHAHLRQSFVQRLGPTLAVRLTRIRQLATGLLAAGLGWAVLIYLSTAPKGANPLGYEPEDTKKYLRDLELYGGKVNVLATEITTWWYGLWQGRNLARSIGWLTLLTAFAFWYLASRRARQLEALEKRPGAGTLDSLP